jgi:hypothetical protein
MNQEISQALSQLPPRMKMWYNRKGESIDIHEFVLLEVQDPNYRVVKQESIGQFHVSTVLIGIDMGWFNHGKAIIFETMIFCVDEKHELHCYQERYSTEEEALRGHEVAVLLSKAWNYNEVD